MLDCKQEECVRIYSSTGVRTWRVSRAPGALQRHSLSTALAAGAHWPLPPTLPPLSLAPTQTIQCECLLADMSAGGRKREGVAPESPLQEQSPMKIHTGQLSPTGEISMTTGRL